MRSLQNEFFRRGFVLVDSRLSDGYLSELKDQLCKLHRGSRLLQLPELAEAELAKIICNDELLCALSEIFGEDIVYFPSLHSQYNSFTQKKSGKKRRGIHIDAAKELLNSPHYMKDQVPAWVNIGFYFQDFLNDGYGGGISAIIGGHRIIRGMIKRFGVRGGVLADFFLRLIQRACPEILIQEVKSKKGMFIIFDNRLPHASIVGPKIYELLKGKSGRAQTFIDAIPRENTKVAIYWFAGKKRLTKEIVENNFVSRLEDGLDMDGGFSYRKAVDMARSGNWLGKDSLIRLQEYGIGIASYDESDASCK